MRPKEKTPAAVNDLRLRTRTALLGLEDKDVAHQAHLGAQHLISDLTADWQHHQVLRDILAVERCNVSARRLRYRLASSQLDKKAFQKDEKLVQMLMIKIIAMASIEKQAAAVKDLCGLMHAIARIAVAGHAPSSEASSEDTCISTAVLRPLLHSAVKSPESQTVSNLYSLAHAALTVVLDSATPPCMVAAAANALRQMLSGLSSGQTGIVVPEAFQTLKQCAEMLGDKIQPPLVKQLLQQCAQHAKHGSPWPVRKQAVDALGALAASLQVYKQADAGWKLEKSASLAVLRSHRAAIEVLLADVKYDKIAHVRQAAMKVIAEMQRIPMPSPRRAGGPQAEGPAGSEEDALIGGDSSPGFQERENIHPHSGGKHGQESGGECTRGEPLQSIDGNLCQASMHGDSKRSPAARSGISTRMQGKANQPAMKRVARPRGVSRMDFGVQVESKDSKSSKTSPATGNDNAGTATAAKHTTLVRRNSAPHTPSQETRNCTGSLVMDPSPLLQQLQMFQDQLRLFASTVTAAADLQTPEQPKLADQQAATVKWRAATDVPPTSEVHQCEMSCSALHVQPTAGQPAISSHDSFRQAMMERLGIERHLAHTLSTTQTHPDAPVSDSSVIGTAPSSQHVLSPPLRMPVHRTGSGAVICADREVIGATPVSNMLGEAVADTSASAGSPASRALTSIRSMLRSLPEASVPVRPESAPGASAEAGSAVPRAAELSGLRRASSSRATGLMDTPMEERGSNPSTSTSAVERALVRLLGPRFGSASPSPDASLTELNKGICDGTLAKSASGRRLRKGGPLASQSAPERAQSPRQRQPSSAPADQESESSLLTNVSGSLSRVHSNPLFAEEAGEGVRRKDSSEGAALDIHASIAEGPGAERGLAADECMMGALGHVLETSLKLDSKGRSGASAGLTRLRHKLSEDLKALQELLLDT